MSSIAATHTSPSPAASPMPTRTLELTREEVVLLRATVTFHARQVTDPDLRGRLEGAARKLDRLAAQPEVEGTLRAQAA